MTPVRHSRFHQLDIRPIGHLSPCAISRWEPLQRQPRLPRKPRAEYTGKRDAIKVAGMNTESDETAGENIHHFQHPMTFESPQQ